MWKDVNIWKGPTEGFAVADTPLSVWELRHLSEHPQVSVKTPTLVDTRSLQACSKQLGQQARSCALLTQITSWELVWEVVEREAGWESAPTCLPGCWESLSQSWAGMVVNTEPRWVLRTCQAAGRKAGPLVSRPLPRLSGRSLWSGEGTGVAVLSGNSGAVFTLQEYW